MFLGGVMMHKNGMSETQYYCTGYLSLISKHFCFFIPRFMALYKSAKAYCSQLLTY